jgi:hypothetical protein
MQEYKNLVERCRKGRLNQVIKNDSISHAGILFDNLFAAAEALPEGEPKEIKVQCHEALSIFYQRYLSAAKNLLDSGTKIRLLVADRNVNPNSNAFLNLVSNHKNGEVRRLGAGANSAINFVVVGNSAYRLEGDQKTVSAVANFNDPISSGVLSGMFEQHWKSATPI